VRAQVIKVFKGKTLSSNLPYKVLFMLPGDGKDVKVIAHLARPRPAPQGGRVGGGES
jgi:hypothetical protein